MADEVIRLPFLLLLCVSWKRNHAHYWHVADWCGR